MPNDTTGQTTTVTRMKEKRESGETPLMSYTAVTSHQTMAEAFMNELVRVGQKMTPDRTLSMEDVLTICHVALDRKERGVVMLEGRHLRGRIGEQISRADRYKEAFSLLVLKLESVKNSVEYDSIVDTLCERMRKTDLMFLFKQRIVLILPHTHADACQLLSRRIQVLLKETVATKPNVEFGHMTYPNPEVTTTPQVLDWAEDQLRTP